MCCMCCMVDHIYLYLSALRHQHIMYFDCTTATGIYKFDISVGYWLFEDNFMLQHASVNTQYNYTQKHVEDTPCNSARMQSRVIILCAWSYTKSQLYVYSVAKCSTRIYHSRKETWQKQSVKMKKGKHYKKNSSLKFNNFISICYTVHNQCMLYIILYKNIHTLA